MKKKLLVALLIAVVSVVPAMTAFAAPGNPSAEGEKFEILEVYDGEGEKVDENREQFVSVTEILETQKPAVEEIEKEENLDILLEDDYSDTLQVIERAEVFIYDVTKEENVEWDSEECDIVFPVTITFSVPGVTPDSELYVLHGHEGPTGTEWHLMDIKSIETGKVTLEFDHFSPVLFLSNNTESGENDTPAGPTSPVSGESNVVLYVALIVVAAATVAVVTRKKMA